MRWEHAPTLARLAPRQGQTAVQVDESPWRTQCARLAPQRLHHRQGDSPLGDGCGVACARACRSANPLPPWVPASVEIVCSCILELHFMTHPGGTELSQQRTNAGTRLRPARHTSTVYVAAYRWSTTSWSLPLRRAPGRCVGPRAPDQVTDQHRCARARLRNARTASLLSAETRRPSRGRGPGVGGLQPGPGVLRLEGEPRWRQRPALASARTRNERPRLEARLAFRLASGRRRTGRGPAATDERRMRGAGERRPNQGGARCGSGTWSKATTSDSLRQIDTPAAIGCQRSPHTLSSKDTLDAGLGSRDATPSKKGVLLAAALRPLHAAARSNAAAIMGPSTLSVRVPLLRAHGFNLR
eukprot:363888-Chlamydomonas_euryale.AAC.11